MLAIEITIIEITVNNVVNLGRLQLENVAHGSLFQWP